MVWPAWSLAATTSSRKFQVKVQPLKLEGLEDEFWREKVMMVGVNWKGGGKFVLPFSSKSRRHKDFSSERILKMGRSWLEWNDEEFENLVDITHGHKWDVSFSILYVGVPPRYKFMHYNLHAFWKFYAHTHTHLFV